MRTDFITAALGLVLAGLSSALPTEDIGLYNFLSKRAVSPDNTCGSVFNGNNLNYTCDVAVNAGGCCSQYGFCGNTTDYCDTGCQSDFGICDAPGTGTPPDDDFTCGPANNNKQCASGLCCSQAGYCGNTTYYCGDGCQSAYGQCNPGASPPAAGGNCGPNFNNAVCSDNQCCSMAGHCGNTEDYCADPGNCMLGFGRCDSDATPAGPSTQNVPRPLKGPVTYTNDIDDCIQDNVIALTYDDGPYEYTAQLLDILKSYGFTATFFITGNNNGKGEIDITSPYPDLIKRMIAEGHQVASHTWSHYSLSNITHDLRISQMVKNEMALNNIIGMWPTYMRPPYSDCTQESGCWDDMQSLGYHRVYFDLDTQDYLNPAPTQIQNSKDIVQQALAVPGVTDYLSIQHDIVEQSVTNLTSYYYGLIQAKGWKGVTVGECLGDTDKSNWYRSFPSSSSTTVPPTSSPTTKPPSTTSKPPTSTPTSKPPTTTSNPPTTTPTSKPPTATSKPPTTTSTSKPPTTTTNPPTTTTPPTSPNPGCIIKSNKWCGQLDPFTNKPTCDKATIDCFAGVPSCMVNGPFNWAACTQWQTICTKLSAYCVKCGLGRKCSNKDFEYKIL